MIVPKRTNSWLDLLQLPDFTWWQFLFAAACMVLLIWLIVRFVSRIHEDVDPAESDQDMLNAITELRRQGDLTEDEYRSIKGQLLSRMSNSFQGRSNEIQPSGEAGQITGKSLTNLFPNLNDIEDMANVSGSEESESIQSATSSSLTEVPGPLHDNVNKTAGSVAPRTENGEGIRRDS